MQKQSAPQGALLDADRVQALVQNMQRLQEQACTAQAAQEQASKAAAKSVALSSQQAALYRCSSDLASHKGQPCRSDQVTGMPSAAA